MAQAPYLTAAAVIGLALFASGTPSPLYGIYSSLWHFSPVVLTLIYATYALGVLATLLVAGRVSDEVGRRPVLLVAVGGIGASTVLYMVASSAAWLFAARGLQGVATGLALSTASAALLDFHRRQDPVATGITNGVEPHRVTDVQAEALRAAESMATEADNQVQMELLPGDMQFINNFHGLHGRTAYSDDRSAGRVRHLKRLWLESPLLADRPPYFTNRSHWEARRSASRLRTAEV